MPVRIVSRDCVEFDSNGKPYEIDEPTNAYHHRRTGFKCRAKQTKLRWHLVIEGEAVALDVEGVLLADETSFRKAGVGRVSIVDKDGNIIYDVFVYYPEDVNHRPSPQWLKLGVKYKDIEARFGARPVAEVLANCERIFKIAGTVIVHAGENEIRYMAPRKLLTKSQDLIDVYGFDLTQLKLYDTQKFGGYRKFGKGGHGKPALKILAAEVLKRDIQLEEHSSVEDAQATMDLFLLHREEFEAAGPDWITATTGIPDSLEHLLPSDSLSSEDALKLADEAGDSSVALIAAVTDKVIGETTFADIVAGRAVPGPATSPARATQQAHASAKKPAWSQVTNGGPKCEAHPTESFPLPQVTSSSSGKKRVPKDVPTA